jgi:uncharacterized protein with FMN-binding domain
LHFLRKKARKFIKIQSKNDSRPIILYNGGMMKNVYFVTMILLLFSLFLACGTTNQDANVQLYQPGTYEGSGDGYFGLITISVTVTENAVTDVEILSHGDTDGIGTIAFEELTQTIMYTNSPDVDVISGATGSSEGFIAAVNDALSKARTE